MDVLLCGDYAHNNLINLLGSEQTTLLNECGQRNAATRAERDEQRREEERRRGCENEGEELSALATERAPVLCGGAGAPSQEPYSGCTGEFHSFTEYWSDQVVYSCYNNCHSTSICCLQHWTCDDQGNCFVDERSRESCHASCLGELETLAEADATCVVPGNGQEFDSDIAEEDLYEANEGDAGEWEPDGGWGESGVEEDGAVDVDVSGEVDNEDLGGREGEREAVGGYSRDDYQEEVVRRTIENLEQYGDDPTPEQRAAARDDAIAETRSEISRRSVTDQRAQLERAFAEHRSRMDGIPEQRHLKANYKPSQWNEHSQMNHTAGLPRQQPSAQMTPDALKEQNAAPQTEKTTGDPVVNGIFCYDEVFSRERGLIDPPVEITGRYCSDVDPRTAPSGALGPGWTLNIESHVQYFIGDNYLSYQGPQGNTIFFMIEGAEAAEGSLWTSGTGNPLTVEALQNSCEEGFGYVATFRAVGQPLVMQATINPDPETCHTVLFSFVLNDGSGGAGRFERRISFAQPFLRERKRAPINGWRLGDGAENVEEIDRLTFNVAVLPDGLAFNQSDLDALRNSFDLFLGGDGERVVREGDPGPLEYHLISQRYPFSFTGDSWDQEIRTLTEEGRTAGLYVSLYRDVGYSFAGNPGLHLSYVSLPRPHVIAPIVEYENSGGPKTRFVRRTEYVLKKIGIDIVSRGYIDQRLETLGEIEEGEASFRGRPVTQYSYHTAYIKRENLFSQWRVVTLPIPVKTTVRVQKGLAMTEAEFTYGHPHINPLFSTRFQNNNYFPAFYRSETEPQREFVQVVPRKPLLTYIHEGDRAVGGQLIGNHPKIRFGYGSPADDERCIDAATGGRQCPYLLKNWIRYNRDVDVDHGSQIPYGERITPPRYYRYAIPYGSNFYSQNAIENAILRNYGYYALMTETGYLGGWPPSEDVERQPYIVNTYGGAQELSTNLVTTHQWGETGTIEYAYEPDVVALMAAGHPPGWENLDFVYGIEVTTRGGDKEYFVYQGEQGPFGKGKLIGHILNPDREDGLPRLSTIYEYATPPAGNAFVQGSRIGALVMSDGQRIEYEYRNSGDDLGFYHWQPSVIRRVGIPNWRTREVTIDYTDPPEGRAGQPSQLTAPSPSGAGNASTTYIYDYQTDQFGGLSLNPCNSENPQGNLVKTIYPDDTFQACTHDVFGRPLECRQRNGRVDRFDYKPIEDAACAVYGTFE